MKLLILFVASLSTVTALDFGFLRGQTIENQQQLQQFACTLSGASTFVLFEKDENLCFVSVCQIHLHFDSVVFLFLIHPLPIEIFYDITGDQDTCDATQGMKNSNIAGLLELFWLVGF